MKRTQTLWAVLGIISTFHPRIFVRNDAARVGQGPTVTEIRRRATDPRYERWRGRPEAKDSEAVVARAERYLETGDGAELRTVRDFLATRTFSYEKNDVGGFLAGAEMATAFDWVYDGLTGEERAAAMAHIVATAESSREFLLRGEPDINHNYTYMALNTVAVCGLVLNGEPEPYGSKAREYLELAREFLVGRGRVLATWNARQGSWSEGSHYTFHETVRNLVMMFAAYRSASDMDYFAVVKQRYGDFLAKTGLFLIGCTRPDFTLVRVGDTSANRISPTLTVPVTVAALATGLGDTDDAARLRSFDDAVLDHFGDKAVHHYYHWGMRVFYDPRARRTPSYTTLPMATRMGPGTTEYIVFRNGWTPDSTHITILAGDHFTDHQHFDAGQFLIYHRGALAVDGGAYDELYKPGGHANEYAQRTLAHNCLLIYNPAQAFPKGYGNDGGQLVLRGFQHHPDWQTYEAHRVREHLNAAEVKAYESDAAGRFDYARVDLKQAYGDRVTAYEREFVYLPRQNYFVVHDRVNAASESFQKRWLLHFQDAPEIDGVKPQPGVTKFSDAQVTTERNGGALFVSTLLPAEHAVTVVGGPGYEYFNPFAQKNYPPSHLNTAAEPRESGRWRIEVSPDRAACEDEFLNAMQIAGPDSKGPVATRRIADASGRVQGVQFGESNVVLFARNATLPLRYEVSSPNGLEHLLVALPPHARVTIEVNGKRVAHATASVQGTLYFSDRGRGRRTIMVH